MLTDKNGNFWIKKNQTYTRKDKLSLVNKRKMVEKEKEIVNTWNGTPPIEDDITKPTD
jgi:hypothetical protein